MKRAKEQLLFQSYDCTFSLPGTNCIVSYRIVRAAAVNTPQAPTYLGHTTSTLEPLYCSSTRTQQYNNFT